MAEKYKTKWLRPGSEEALKAGCTCPILDNNHGLGIGGDGEKFGWWMSADCPIHKANLPEKE